MNISLEFMNELLAAEQYLNNYITDEAVAKDGFTKANGQQITIPAINNLSGTIKSFIQKLEHAAQAVYKFTQVFFDHKERFFTGFLAELETKYGIEDEFVIFAKELEKFMLFIRNVRHCIEHPNPSQRLIVENFKLNASGHVTEPTIEIIHSTTPEPQISISVFMQQILASMLSINETLMLHLADKQIIKNKGFEKTVGKVPLELRSGNTLVQVGYFINFNGAWHPLNSG